jgi:hypothetical protein
MLVAVSTGGRRRRLVTNRGGNHVRLHRISTRSIRRVVPVAVAVCAVTVTIGLTTASGGATGSSFTFSLQPSSAAITSCLPNAAGTVTINSTPPNYTMKVTISGLPHNTDYDLFVIQQPTAPFGVAWYQTDIHAGSTGSGSATVRGVFSKETFSVSPGGTTTFAPTHQYHLGVWFNNPKVPFNHGCEPGATAPIVTPFNGAQNAGIQVLNTGSFPVNAGPLSHVS